MRKMLLDIAPPSVVWPGKRVSASTHAGAFCVLELRGAVWRRSSQALSGTGCAITSDISVAEGRPSLKASCAHTRDTAAKKIARTTRTSIGLARLFEHSHFASFQFQCGLTCRLCVISNTADRMLNTTNPTRAAIITMITGGISCEI